MRFARIPVSHATVCASEVCQLAAVTDAHAISRGTGPPEALKLLDQAKRELGTRACWYCGCVRFEAYRRPA